MPIVRDERGIPTREEENFLLALAQSAGRDAEARKAAPKLIRDRAERARNDLVTRHYRFIWTQARQFALRTKRPDLADDFEQEAVLGFLDAIDGYDLGRPVRLVSYAGWHCVKRMREFLLNSNPIHVPRYLVYGHATGPDSGADGEAGLSARIRSDRARQRLIRASAARALSPMVRVSDLRARPDSERIRALEDPSQPDPADLAVAAEEHDLLECAMAGLNPALREVLVARFGFLERPKTLKEIGWRFGVCRERVRQLERRAIQDLLVNLHACAGRRVATEGPPAA